MKLTRLMVLEKREVKKYLIDGKITFDEKTCWSGENSTQGVDLNDLIQDNNDIIVLFRITSNLDNFRRPTEEEIESDASDWQELDEYRSLIQMTCNIKNHESILEELEEDFYFDTGFLDLDLI